MFLPEKLHQVIPLPILVLFHQHSESLSQDFQPHCHFSGINRERDFRQQRLMCQGSHLSKLQNNFEPGEELFNIIKSTCTENEGPNHRWLNNICNGNNFLGNGGVLLVLANAYTQENSFVDRHNRILMIELAKFLQKRHPKIGIIGLQCVDSVNSVEMHLEVLTTIMEEYISFPILLLERNLFQVMNSFVYLFCEGATSHPFYINTKADFGSIKKALDELYLLQKENMTENLSGDKIYKHATFAEPNAPPFRNLLMYNAGPLSVDEDGGRIFLSDCNHHRIIITDTSGRILDSIGSSPGFVDADFESAKLWRPAASYYNTVDGCLYFADSENNAIRKADMARRLVETVYPIPKSDGIWDRIAGAWSWIQSFSWFAKDNTKKEDDFDQIASPWHLLNVGDNELIIISHSFAVAWTMSMRTWKLKEVIKGFHTIYDLHGNLIAEKISCLRDAHSILPQKFSMPVSCDDFPFLDLMSSVGNFHDDIITYDEVDQSLLKYNRESMQISHIHFSNVGVLGMPYWLSLPIEKVYNSGHYFRYSNEQVQNFSVLPGRCDINLSVEIPNGTVLVAPLDENCVWLQARGSAAVSFALEEDDPQKEKVGVAQQWFDELDNLAFANPELENLESRSVVDDDYMGNGFRDSGNVHFNCVVHVSPGTSEVIISAAVYLKPNPALSFQEAASLLNPHTHENRMIERECFNLFLKKRRKISDLIFTRPLHIRIRLDCRDHPPAPTSKETILTDTRLELNLSVE